MYPHTRERKEDVEKVSKLSPKDKVMNTKFKLAGVRQENGNSKTNDESPPDRIQESQNRKISIVSQDKRS